MCKPKSLTLKTPWYFLFSTLPFPTKYRFLLFPTVHLENETITNLLSNTPVHFSSLSIKTYNMFNISNRLHTVNVKKRIPRSSNRSIFKNFDNIPLSASIAKTWPYRRASNFARHASESFHFLRNIPPCGRHCVIRSPGNFRNKTTLETRFYPRASKSRRTLKWNCTKYHFINLARKSVRSRQREGVRGSREKKTVDRWGRRGGRWSGESTGCWKHYFGVGVWYYKPRGDTSGEGPSLPRGRKISWMNLRLGSRYSGTGYGWRCWAGRMRAMFIKMRFFRWKHSGFIGDWNYYLVITELTIWVFYNYWEY